MGLRLPPLDPLSRTFRSRAKLPSLSPAPLGPPICRVRASLRCRVQSELGPRQRGRRPRAKVLWLSCAGCEMTMARRFSFCLDLYPCFCGSFFVSARQQRAGLRTDCRGCPFCADALPNQMLLDGPEQRVHSKRSTNTQSVSGEKLPVARLLR